MKEIDLKKIAKAVMAENKRMELIESMDLSNEDSLKIIVIYTYQLLYDEKRKNSNLEKIIQNQERIIQLLEK